MEYDFLNRKTGDVGLDELLERFGPPSDNPNRTIARTPVNQATIGNSSTVDHLNADGFESYLKEKGATLGETTSSKWDGKSFAKQSDTVAKDVNFDVFNGKSIGAEKGSRGKELLGFLGGNTDELTQGTGALATKKMGGGDYASLAMGMVQVGKSINDWDTSGAGSGPGKAGGKIIQNSATTFSAVQQATGNPIIAGVATLGVAAATALGHKKAMNEYIDNQIAYNKEQDAVKDAEFEESYRMAQGMRSLENLKALREKQLGILKA